MPCGPRHRPGRRSAPVPHGSCAHGSDGCARFPAGTPPAWPKAACRTVPTAWRA
ncbi:hypothetical protein MGSAQ_002276 [marine sediment metagenome]|uniref:Uncharacterized protein n=1 Tax=marine sediment metagenome TaxID=412755 RepID=A0A1B6NSB5_9ZZZZ